MASENKRARDTNLTQGNIGAHLRRLAAPALIGFFFNVMFNVTDTFCAGLISTDAQAAIAFSFVLFFIVLSFGVGMSQSANGLLSRAIGGSQHLRVRLYTGQMLSLVAMLSACIMLFGAYSNRPLIEFMGAEAHQSELGLEYIFWIYAAAPLLIGTFALSGMLSAQGNTTSFRNALIVSSLLNMLLDPMLAFGWFGLPALGMRGIGIATFLAYLLQTLWLLTVLVRSPQLRNFPLSYFKPRLTYAIKIIVQGLPATMNMMATNIAFFVCTLFLARIDSLAVAAYGIALRIEQIVLLPTVGLNIAFLSVAAQNYGANRFDRTLATMRLALRYGLILASISILFMLAGGNFLISQFNPDPLIISFGYGYLIAAAILAPVYIYIHVYTSMLQAVGRPAMIAPMGFLRLAVLPLAFNILFSFGLDLGAAGVWCSLVAANLIVAILLSLYTRGLLQRILPAAPSLVTG